VFFDKLRWWWPLLWLALITWFSVTPGPQLPDFQLISMDKLNHALAYGVLCWLLLRALRPLNRRRRWGAFLFCVLYGILMEWVQYAFVPGRFYEYADMLANALGSSVFLVMSDE
jgi:VanZ family protein